MDGGKNILSSNGLHWLFRLKKKIQIALFSFIVLCIVAAMLFLAIYLRSSLLEASRDKTRELSATIHSGLKVLMQTRSARQIQSMLDGAAERGSIERIFIVNNRGEVAFTTDPALAATRFDKNTESGCTPCHASASLPPSDGGVLIELHGSDIQRNVRVIYNERSCFECHPAEQRVIGKLIIDRPIRETIMLIRRLEIFMLLSGLISLLFAWFLISSGLNRYILAIQSQHSQLNMLYSLVERLSKTIDSLELRDIVCEILRDTISADVITIALPAQNRGYVTTAWLARTGASTRTQVEQGSELHHKLLQWLDGSFEGHTVSADGRQVYLALRKGEVLLAFIAAHRTEAPFTPDHIEMLSIIMSHVAVAFDNARLYWMAITDELTGLFVQRHFKHSIEREVRKCRLQGLGFSLLMMDLDDFKKVNDTHGHLEGDAVLREAAHRMRSALRHTDMTFRYGGEEFAALLPGAGRQEAADAAERIRLAVCSEPIITAGHEHHVTVSVGGAICPDNACDDLGLLAEADKALYRAKGAGKNRVEFSKTAPHGADGEEPYGCGDSSGLRRRT